MSNLSSGFRGFRSVGGGMLPNGNEGGNRASLGPMTVNPELSGPESRVVIVPVEASVQPPLSLDSAGTYNMAGTVAPYNGVGEEVNWLNQNGILQNVNTPFIDTLQRTLEWNPWTGSYQTYYHQMDVQIPEWIAAQETDFVIEKPPENYSMGISWLMGKPQENPIIVWLTNLVLGYILPFAQAEFKQTLDPVVTGVVDSINSNLVNGFSSRSGMVYVPGAGSAQSLTFIDDEYPMDDTDVWTELTNTAIDLSEIDCNIVYSSVTLSSDSALVTMKWIFDVGANAYPFPGGPRLEIDFDAPAWYEATFGSMMGWYMPAPTDQILQQPTHFGWFSTDDTVSQNCIGMNVILLSFGPEGTFRFTSTPELWTTSGLRGSVTLQWIHWSDRESISPP